MILLTAKPEIILRRVEAEGGVRPLLNVENKFQEILNLLAERNSEYIQAADLIFDTSEMKPEQVTEKILASIWGDFQ
jgi:shikimate dehydrogenase/shikimate kinase